MQHLTGALLEYNGRNDTKMKERLSMKFPFSLLARKSLGVGPAADREWWELA